MMTEPQLMALALAVACAIVVWLAVLLAQHTSAACAAVNQAREGFNEGGDWITSEPVTSRRDLFAAHAPKPAWWFVPITNDKPTPPSMPIGLTDHERLMLDEWRRDPHSIVIDAADFPEVHRADVMRFLARHSAYQRELALWKAERAKQRDLQWPWAWADLVLASEDVRRQGGAAIPEGDTAMAENEDQTGAPVNQQQPIDQGDGGGNSASDPGDEDEEREEQPVGAEP